MLYLPNLFVESLRIWYAKTKSMIKFNNFSGFGFIAEFSTL